MTSADAIAAISQVGFPAVIAIALLYWVTRSLNGKLDRLAKAVEQNTEQTQALAQVIDRGQPVRGFARQDSRP